MKWVKRFVALLLLPACAGIAATTYGTALDVVASAVHSGRLYGLAFAAGYLFWLAIFVFLPPPTRTYVLGHELTHALWALLMGARVSGLRVGKSGGQVQTSKINWLITLAPYFFPFYAMLFILGFFLMHLFRPLDQYLWVLFALVGLGWSFHVTFTLFTLLTARQPDVQSQGWLFSMVVIFGMNLLVILLTTVALAQTVDLVDTARALGNHTLAAYGWTLDHFLWLWHRAIAAGRDG